MAQVDDLQQQLGYFQAWASSLATAAPKPQALDATAVLSTLQLLVTGLPPGTSEGALEAWLNDLASAHGAAVAPGPAVSSVQLQRQAAVVQLRCALEASNCLAFDGMQMNGATLQVTRPRDYCPATALLLGPCQPNPAVVVSVRRAWHAKPAASAAPDHDHPSFAAVAASKAATAAGGHCSCSFAAAVRSSHPVHAPMTCRVAADGSCCAGSAEPCGSAACKTPTAARDLLMAPDQSKQDEVFIGGLPSHWKAQQVKELLAPYGQLKSLSVAMDAATGKNKGYAFVVFASSASLAQAIEELDCRVVEGGKILAVQRATDGKAAGSSARESMTGSDTGALRDGGGSSSSQQLPLLQQQPHLLQQQRPAQRMSSGSLAPAAAPAAAGAPAAAAAAEVCHAAAVGPAAGCISQQAAVALAAAGGDDSTTLGQRLLAAVGGGGGGGGSSGGHGMKQYDVNELYIGDLPLSWDEDAVRRLLGRYGKIKYFTLRNGRDKNFAFVKYKDAAVVEPAIAGLHGKIVDGYFLNVRRAIEGKQQHQQQQHQQWAGAKQQQQQQQSHQQPQGQQQGQQQQLGRGGLYEARGSFDAGSRAARLRLSLDQQLHCQQQKPGQQQLGAPMLHKGAQPLKGPPPPPAAAGFGRGLPGPGAAAASSQPQQAVAAHSSAELLRAGQLAVAAPAAAAAPPAVPAAAGMAPEPAVAAASAAGGAAVAGPAAQSGQEPAGASVQPGAGTAMAEAQQQQQPALVPAAGTARTGSGSAPGELQAQLPQTFVAAVPPAQGPAYRHPLQQPQQQQQPGLLPVGQPPFQAAQTQQQAPQQSLFMHHGPSASWGAPGEAAGSSNGNGNGRGSCQGQPPRQSLLQTWDMLSPWSLFSHTAQ